MPAGKLENGAVSAALTTAAITFKVTSLTMPNFNGGDAPDTTTNDNTTFRSKGVREFIDIEDLSLTGAFLAADYDVLPTLINSTDTLTVTDRQGSTYVFSVRVASYTPSEMTEDGFPTADLSFTVLTGVDGDTAPVITPAI
jgi:hypothetical protein